MKSFQTAHGSLLPKHIANFFCYDFFSPQLPSEKHLPILYLLLAMAVSQTKGEQQLPLGVQAAQHK